MGVSSALHQRGATPMSHEIWRRVRRPFRYPACTTCKWEIYDANQAGCVKCGRHHFCHLNSVDNTCQLIECDDRTRVCSVTGLVLPEVRHAKDEYMEGVTYPCPPRNTMFHDINTEVTGVVANFLTSSRACECREQENSKQNVRLAQHMLRQMKNFKFSHPGEMPNMCWILAHTMKQEKYWRFIENASEDLVHHSSKHITKCIMDMKEKGVKITSGPRMWDLVCGLLYMLKHGLTFQSRVILPALPEVDRCLPHENKIEAYFGISSKVICMTENEVKFIFRESYQT